MNETMHIIQDIQGKMHYILIGHVSSVCSADNEAQTEITFISDKTIIAPGDCRTVLTNMGINI
jgi:hypothetical protein